MRKTILLVLGALLFASFASAAKIDIYSFKVYLDDEKQSVSWEDDEFEAYVGATMEVQLRFENNWNETIEIETKGILFEIGDDIERTKTIQLSKDDKKTIVFEYFIPNGTREDVYEFDIAYEYNTNEGNITLHYEENKTFEIDIKKKTTPQEDILVDITKQLADEKAKTNNLLSTVLSTQNMSIRLTECEKELGNAKLNDEFKTKYEAELGISRACEIKIATCDTEKKQLYTKSQLDSEVELAKLEAIKQQKSTDNWQTVVVAVGIIFYYNWKKKKETVGGKGEGVSAYGASWR